LETYRDFLEPLFIEHFKLFLNFQPTYKLSENKQVIPIEALNEFVLGKMLKFFRFEFRRNLKRYSSNLSDLTRSQADDMINEVYNAVLNLNNSNKDETKGNLII